jgi:hypothetical protein
MITVQPPKDTFDLAGRFEIFQKEVTYWAERFGLTEWHIYVDTMDDNDYAAQCATNTSGMQSVISLNRSRGSSNVSIDDIKHDALHEVLELLLDEWKPPADSGLDIRGSRHRVINRLIEVLLPERIKDEQDGTGN